MPVEKFKTFEKASKSLWVKNPDSKYYETLMDLFEFWGELNTTKVKKGLMKFTSFDEFMQYKNFEVDDKKYNSR